MNVKSLIIPLTIIAVGATWLLSVMNILPNIDWVWTIGWGVAGLLTLAFGGINKVTVVAGPFLIACSLASFFRQTGHLPLDREVPILTIVLGCLMLLVQALKLPLPNALKPDDSPELKKLN
jgi:hypothetical protein